MFIGADHFKRPVYKKPVNDRVSSSVLARLKTLEILRTAIQVSAIRKPSK